jgi:predicted Zn-dependent protease
MNENRLHEAEPLLRALLKEDPFDVRAIRMFAELAGRIGRYTDAENLLRRAIELAPDFTPRAPIWRWCCTAPTARPRRWTNCSA